MSTLYDQSRIAREESSIPVKQSLRKDAQSLTYSFSETSKHNFPVNTQNFIKMHTPISSIAGFIAILVVQIIFGIVFGAFSEYGKEILPHKDGEPALPTNLGSYPHFQDIHVMIFIGFGFLMTFLKKYGYSATGFNLLVASLMVQWALIARGCFEMEDGKIRLTLGGMIGADIAAATVLISMGALLGRTTPIQLLVMGLFEIAVFAANEYLQLEYMKIADVGGSITVHAFGAYFGLAVSFILRPKKSDLAITNNLEGPSYTSDIFAMVGTIFLWIFWPSFNSALVAGADQERAILNTYLGLAAATVVSFVLSVLVSHEHKLDMVHVQNSTLAGGVAVGSVCNLLIHPYGAVLIGSLAGLISVLGYRYLSPGMLNKLRLDDTCGVHNLHGMPAVLSAIFSAIFAAAATTTEYGDSLYNIFPAMQSRNSTDLMEDGHHSEPTPFGGYGRSAVEQAGYQLLGILSTVAIAIVGGLLTGVFLRSPSVRIIPRDKQHDDEDSWEVPAP
ncbi:ammonium transporter Rh type B [Phlebotomus argentipes]|uniref:ammonium transporter Rh type B n=1 Tax=Phlebotomus argentipes TaxID=94469 RepID=UPI002892F32D|nr:ammonium transporter Rh type B [Phlebotomus argentipes]